MKAPIAGRGNEGVLLRDDGKHHSARQSGILWVSSTPQGPSFSRSPMYIDVHPGGTVLAGR
jgi:hypothetical protein